MATKKAAAGAATIGARIDEIVTLQLKLATAQAKLAPLAAEIEAKREALFTQTKKAELDGAAGALGTAAVTKTPVPNIKDFDKFFAYAKRKGNEDLLPRTVAVAAWRERYNQKITVPGIETFQRVSLRITARKTKKGV